LALVVFAWYGSLVPLNFSPRSLSEAWSTFTMMPVDFKDPSMVDWGINALLLIPAGFCLLGAATRPGSSLGQRLFRTIVVAAGCLVVSLSIEFSQSWFPPRVPSPADVIAQFLGAAAGIVAWWVCGRPFNRALTDFLADKRTDSSLDLVLLAYVAGFLLYSVAPLDLTLHPSELLQKYRSGRILLVPFSQPRIAADGFLLDVVTDILLFVPVGVFSATFPTRKNATIRPLSRSLLIGATIVFGIELVQLLVVSRFTDTTDLITGITGVALGALGYQRFSRRPIDAAAPVAAAKIRLLFYAAAYVLLLVAILWRPYDFSFTDTAAVRQRMSHFLGLPLSRALQGDYFSALNGFLQKFLLFAPLGAWIAVFTATLRPAARFVANAGLFCLTAALALAIELGQILLPSRFASFDDVLICSAGALIGLWAMSRVFYAQSPTADRPTANTTPADGQAASLEKRMDRAL
jgi:glycopeptide antibiotics resistance protein